MTTAACDQPFAGLVVALIGEARCLAAVEPEIGATTRVPGGGLVCLSGVGPQRATAAARLLLDAGAGALLSFGTCGALRAVLEPGDLLLPTTVRDEAGATRGVDSAWRARLLQALADVHGEAGGGTLLSSARPLVRRQDKADAAATGAIAVDMESAAVAEVAEAASVPFLAVRVVADGFLQPLPQAVLAAVDELGRPRASALVAALALHPGEWVRAGSAARAFACATRTLRMVARVRPGALAFAGCDRA